MPRKKATPVVDATVEVEETSELEQLVVHPKADMISQALNHAGTTFGGTAGSTLQEDIRKGIFGTPLPHFCQRYFFTSNVLPAGKSYLLAGVQGVGKTAMMIEFLRIIASYAKRAYGSAMVMGVHSEEKWPDTLPPSIMGDLSQYLRVDGAENAQEWMAKLSMQLNGNPKTGFRGFRNEPLNSFPTAMFVDSIHGAQGAERSKKIKKEGSPGRDFSEIARITSDWFPDFSKWLGETAAVAFFILHLKATQDGWNTAGGKAKDFFASYTIHLNSPKKKVGPTKEGSIDFWMSLRKDSYGPGGIAMPMSMRWEFDESGMQRTWFDWETCTCKMFETWMGSGEHALIKSSPARKYLDGFGSRLGGNVGKLYTLPGVTGDEEYLPPVEFNQALEANTEFKTELDKAFHITQRYATHEYFALLEQEAKELASAKRKGKRKKKALPELPPDMATGPAVDEDD